MINNEHNMTEKAWIVTVDMGYGHQRAVHALGFLGKEGVLTIGESEYTSAQEKKLWKRMLNSYEYLSRAKNIPLIGKYLFRMMDKLLYIPSFYPKRNLSQKTFQVSILNHYISKGICSGVLTKIKENTQIPLITSFYAPAIAADIAGFPEIYCIICDADLNRVWVASDPAKSRIKYLAPCYRSAQRLKSYGVPKQRIFITGFPFSFDLVGSESLDILRKDLAQRLFYLDPNYRFWNIHRVEIEYYLGKDLCTFKKERNLTIMYAVGGAGAQKEIAEKIALSLFDKIRFDSIRLILCAGIRTEVREYFEKIKLKLGNPENIEILFNESKQEYLKNFDQAIRRTDILWTKPSELIFYSGLGIPIIMTPAVGAQERENRKWIREIQAGVKQNKPQYCDQWLFDLINQGRLAEAAWSGFLKARKAGTYKIIELLQNGTIIKSNSPLRR